MVSPFRYRIVVEWSNQVESYVAFVPSLPGCKAAGESVEEAAREVQAAAEELLEELRQQDEDLPQEDHAVDYTGQIQLRVPRSLHGHLERLADSEGVPLDQVVSLLLMQQPSFYGAGAAGVAPKAPQPSPGKMSRRTATRARPIRRTVTREPEAMGRRQALTWSIKRRKDRTLIVFEGEIDERVDFKQLMPLTGRVIFDLAGVSRFNSEGVREWIEFVNSLNAVNELAFVRCSVAVINQLNLFHGIKGKAEVRSFYAPYYCKKTGEEELRLLTKDEIPDPRDPPRFPCSGGEMELDEAPERFFAFLIDAQRSQQDLGASV